MKYRSIAALASVACALGMAAPAQAKGCLKGAAVGGVAGHVAGHHGVAGAGVGCLVGRHRAKKQEEKQQVQQQQQPQQPQVPATQRNATSQTTRY
jgi:hypothetical protein